MASFSDGPPIIVGAVGFHVTTPRGEGILLGPSSTENKKYLVWFTGGAVYEYIADDISPAKVL